MKSSMIKGIESIKLKLNAFSELLYHKCKNYKHQWTKENEMHYYESRIKNDIMYIPFMINILLKCKIKSYATGKQPITKFTAEMTPLVHKEIFQFIHDFYCSEIATFRDNSLKVFFNELMRELKG